MSKEKVVLSITKPVPKAATWTFRILLILTTASWFVISGNEAISAMTKKTIADVFQAINFVVWALGRFLGVEKDIKPNGTEEN